MSNKAIFKYLEQYAEPEVAELSGLTIEANCQNTLVIPALLLPRPLVPLPPRAPGRPGDDDCKGRSTA